MTGDVAWRDDSRSAGFGRIWINQGRLATVPRPLSLKGPSAIAGRREKPHEPEPFEVTRKALTATSDDVASSLRLPSRRGTRDADADRLPHAKLSPPVSGAGAHESGFVRCVAEVSAARVADLSTRSGG